MNGLLQVVLTLLAINTAVVRSCSTFTRQINLTICNWQEVRGNIPLCFQPAMITDWWQQAWYATQST